MNTFYALILLANLGFGIFFKKMLKRFFSNVSDGRIFLTCLLVTTVLSCLSVYYFGSAVDKYTWIIKSCTSFIPLLIYLSPNTWVNSTENHINGIASALFLLALLFSCLLFFGALLFNKVEELFGIADVVLFMALTTLSYFYKLVSVDCSSFPDHFRCFCKIVRQIDLNQFVSLWSQLMFGLLGLLSFARTDCLSGCLYGLHYLFVGKKIKGSFFLIVGNAIQYNFFYNFSPIIRILFDVYFLTSFIDFSIHICKLIKSQKYKKNHRVREKVGI